MGGLLWLMDTHAGDWDIGMNADEHRVTVEIYVTQFLIDLVLVIGRGPAGLAGIGRGSREEAIAVDSTAAKAVHAAYGRSAHRTRPPAAPARLARSAELAASTTASARSWSSCETMRG